MCSAVMAANVTELAHSWFVVMKCWCPEVSPCAKLYNVCVKSSHVKCGHGCKCYSVSMQFSYGHESAVALK